MNNYAMLAISEKRAQDQRMESQSNVITEIDTCTEPICKEFEDCCKSLTLNGK